MPRHRHNSSESSSDDDSSDDSSQKRNKKRRQHSSQDRQRHRNQRSDSSDSGHDSKMIRSKVNLNQKSNRSGGRKRQSVSVESDRSPVRERKDGSKSRQAEAQRRDRKRRSSSGDSSGSENRKKRSNRKRSPSEKRERRKHSDSDSEEPSSPTKPVLASRVNYMKSLNPDRSKWMPKKKSPSRRKVQSLADDYMRGEQQSSRWRVESLADDYRKDRYRNSSRGDRDRKDERGKGRDERSPRRKSPKRSQIRSAERHSFDRSPRRSPKRRSRDRSLEKNISPERKRSEVKRRSPRRSPLQRSPHMQISPKRRSPERSPKRHRSADRQRSSFKGSVEKARSPDRQKAPVRRSPARRSQDRQSSPLRRSTERQRARLRKSLEKSPTPQSPDRQATRSLDRQRSLELHSPVKRVPVRRPPLQRNQRRQSPEERSIQRLSAERIYAPQDRQEADPRSSVRRLSGRPLARRRSEEDLSSRFSPEGSFVQRASIDRPLSRRSPGISPLRPLSRRRSSAERSFPVRRSLEGNVNQRYLALSPPRSTEPRIRARSLERISRRTDTDRLSQREMQPNIFRRFRRDSDRGLYDDLPEPMGIRSPPIERRWREEPEYLNRYRDDMDLPQRSVYVDRDVNVRVLNDRSDESDERTFRYRDHRGNKAFNRPRPSQFQGRRQQRNDEPFRFMENRNWRSERNELHETDADNHRSAEMIEPKRRRLDVNIRRGSLSPTRGWGRSGENPRAVIISRSRSPVSPERNRENRNATRNASRSSSESEEESPAHGSKLSSTVTMVSRKEKHVRSPPMQLKNDKVKKTSSEEHDRIRSSRRQSYSPQRLKRETMDHLRMEKDKLVPLKKRSRSPEQSVRGRNNTDVLEMDKSDKKSLKSPRKSKRDHTATKDRSVSSRKSSRSPLQSPTRPMDSNRSATERGRSDRSIRSNQLSPKERLDSVTSEQEQEFTRAFEMERMDSMVSEQDFGRSFERERFDSTASEQEMLQRSQSIDVEEEGRDNVDDYESGPESGELTDSDEEAAKKNALIKSLVNKPSLEELDADEEERQRLEDQHYLEEKRQQALERIEAEKETVASKVVKVTDSRKDKEERRERGRDDKRDNKRKRHAEDVSGSKPDTSQLEQEPVPKKKPKPDPTGAEALTMRTGGAYIPPAKLRAMQESITDKSSVAYQRMSWEALKKSINGLINKVNVSNIEYIVRELFQENIVRGRGLMARSIIQAQAASPTFTHVYAVLVAIVNTKFPQNGELILRRLVIQFRRGFKRNDKSICLSTTRFVAHLVNQQVAHEVLALEILTLLLETPTDDSVEIAVGFLKECGQKLTEVTPRGINAIFERLRNVLHEGQIDIRVQYMVEVMFAVRKDGFKDHPSVLEDLDLVEEEDQFTHLLTLEDAGDPENMLSMCTVVSVSLVGCPMTNIVIISLVSRHSNIPSIVMCAYLKDMHMLQLHRKF